MCGTPCRALLLAAALTLPSASLAQRDSVRASLAPALRAPAALVDPGPKPFVTLLCKFSDVASIEPASRDHFTRYFATSEYPSVSHYWTEVGAGRFSLEGSKVAGWYVLPGLQHDYVSPTGFGVNFARLEQDCLNAADADVDFSAFHGINFVVNTNLDGYLYAGGVQMTRDGVTRMWPATYLDGSVANSIGLAAHEIGHTFGLPHSSGPYGATYDSQWDVMSLAVVAPVPGTSIRIPMHPNAWQKLRLGVIPTERQAVASVGTTTLLLERHARPADNANPLVLTIPIPRPGTDPIQQYYVVETRGGPDAGYDRAHPEQVVVIHRFINFQGVLVWDVDGNGDPNDAGAQWTVGETYVDRENDIRVAIEAQVGTAFRITVTVGDRKLVAVTPTGRSRTVAAGTSGLRADSAAVTFAGSGTAAQPWTARAGGRSRRITVTTAAGSGAGMVRWSENASLLAPGTYLDSIHVDADVANGPGILVDTLIVTAAPSLTLGLAVASRSDSLLSGGSSTHTVLVRPSGPGATTAGWTATKTAAWIAFNAGGDTGVGVNEPLSWTHNATGLAPGVYVDTFTVTLDGTAVSARLVDTLRVLQPLALSLSRLYGSSTVEQASITRFDSVYATITGPWAAGAAINTVMSSGTPTFLSALRQGFGSGWVRIRRAPASLAPGTYVNRVRIAIALDTSINVWYEDTLRVVAAPPKIVLSRTSGRDTMENNSWLSADSVFVQPAGEGGPFRPWQTTANVQTVNLQPRNGTLPFGSGNGPGWLVWMRNTASRTPGTWVDTLTVSFLSGPGSPARFIDTLVVLGTPLLAIVSDSVRRGGVMGAPYADTLRAQGGTGEWTWTMVSGTLPQGLTLTTAGRVAGIVESSGVFRFTARVTSGSRVMERQFRIDVTTPVLGAAAVFDRLLSGTAMHEDLLRYLDLQGNRNGRFDVGDARAWLSTNSSSAVSARADTARTMRTKADTARGRERP